MSKDPERYLESNAGNLPLKVVVNWHGRTSAADGPDAMGAAVGEKNAKFTQGTAARLLQPPIQLCSPPGPPHPSPLSIQRGSWCVAAASGAILNFPAR